MKKIITAGLCNNRHDIPVDDYVFRDNIKDPTNVSLLEKQAKSWLKSKFQNLEKNKMEKELIEYRVLDTIKCPFCNSTSYLVLQAFVDKEWVNAPCRCEQCNRKFTIVYRAEEIFSKAD